MQMPPYDYFWLLEPSEQINSVGFCQWIPMQEIQRTVAARHQVDSLFLVKWK